MGKEIIVMAEIDSDVLDDTEESVPEDALADSELDEVAGGAPPHAASE